MKYYSNALFSIGFTMLMLAVSASSHADIVVHNHGGYVVTQICTNSYLGHSCEGTSLPIGQSYAISSDIIPDEGVQVELHVLCAAWILLPIADAIGTSRKLIKDGEHIDLSGACFYFAQDADANIMPNADNIDMQWLVNIR